MSATKPVLPWWARKVSTQLKMYLSRVDRGVLERPSMHTFRSALERGLVVVEGGVHVLTERGRAVLAGDVAPIPEQHHLKCSACGLVVDVRDLDQVEYLEDHICRGAA
jgi:hypothetical protein